MQTCTLSITTGWSPMWRLGSCGPTGPAVPGTSGSPAQSSEQHKVQCWQLDSDEPGSPHQCKSNVMTFVRRIITTITASWSYGILPWISHWKQNTPSVWILNQRAKRISLLKIKDRYHQSYSTPFDRFCFIWPFPFFKFLLLHSKAEFYESSIKDDFEWKWFICFGALLGPIFRKNGKIQSW